MNAKEKTYSFNTRKKFNIKILCVFKYIKIQFSKKKKSKYFSIHETTFFAKNFM